MRVYLCLFCDTEREVIDVSVDGWMDGWIGGWMDVWIGG